MSQSTVQPIDHHSNSQPHRSFLTDYETVNLHMCSPVIIQNSDLRIPTPNSAFWPMPKPSNEFLFSGSFSINSKCLRRSEFQSYSLQHSETFMLCLGSTSMFYNSRVPQRRKAKLWDSFHMFPLSQGSPSYAIYSSIPDNSCPTYFTLFYIFSFWGKMERRKGCY